jgi:hypothetical protein
MKSVWITYSWEDNRANDVDFIAQELEQAGLIVKLDRWNIVAGQRLWEQIETFIQDSNQSDGWLFYATQTSLGSNACKEEYAYALDRTINIRGNDYPIIALFPKSIDDKLIPAGIRTRLYVSLTDPDWKERIVSAVEKRTFNKTSQQILPFYMFIHNITNTDGDKYAIEVRPRAGTWSPFIAGVPIQVKDSIDFHILHGPSNHVPTGGVLFDSKYAVSKDSQWLLAYADNEATPTQSYYIFFKQLPSKIVFGKNDGPTYTVDL